MKKIIIMKTQYPLHGFNGIWRPPDMVMLIVSSDSVKKLVGLTAAAFIAVIVRRDAPCGALTQHGTSLQRQYHHSTPSIINSIIDIVHIKPVIAILVPKLVAMAMSLSTSGPI